ncbi:MAG TPA: DUF4190 domain-containing protein [Kofleriaceae bacterium]|nr:DUF4190 domain-containing protein [Kofleriaceae bacterium]
MTTPYAPRPPAAPPVAQTSTLAVAGFVCSFFCSVLGLILSIMGRNECLRSGGALRGEGLALAGIIISSIFLALSAIGIVAAIAIPSFIDYAAKGKRTEADLNLMKIEKAVRQYAVENSELPRASAPLTPAASCCTDGTRKCFDVSSWRILAWQQIDFSIEEPHSFQYSYESDGKTFTARAVGDLDCDGDTVTYELQGALSDSGGVTFTKRGPIGRD